MVSEQNGSSRKNGRVRKVPLSNPVRCLDCAGVGWPPKPNSSGDMIDWEWPCQTCDTEGEVEGCGEQL